MNVSAPIKSELLFNRQIGITIGPKAGQGRLITGLKTVFHVEKNLEKHPNPSTIEITNPSQETISFIESISVKGTNGPYIILRAGYGTGAEPDKLPLVYKGDIAKFTVKKNGPAVVMTIESGDGEFAFNNARTELSFRAGATFGTVLDSLKTVLGIGTGPQIGINRADTFLNGLSLSGNVRDHLDTLTKRQGLMWSIQNDQLQILPASGFTSEPVVILSPKTGLIGSPFKTKIIRPELTKQTKEIQVSGMKFLSLLNNELQCGRKVKVESEYVNGIFRIEKVTHTGDTHGQPWYSEVECR